MIGVKIDDLLHLLVGRAAALVPLLLIAVGRAGVRATARFATCGRCGWA